MNGLKKMAERATVSFGEKEKPKVMNLPPPPEKITSFEEVEEDDGEAGTDALGLPKGVKRIY